MTTIRRPWGTIADFVRPHTTYSSLLVAAFAACAVPEHDASSTGIEVRSEALGAACQLDVLELGLNQAVHLPLMRLGLPSRVSTPIVVGKPALVQLRLAAAPVERPFAITLDLANDTRQESIHIASTFDEDASSPDATIPLEGDWFDGTARFRLRVAAEGCDPGLGSIFPRRGWQAFGERDPGRVRVMMVPIVSTIDASVPPVTPELMTAMREATSAMYPTSTVELQLHEIVTTTLDIGLGFETWGDLIGELRALQRHEALDPRIHYYGLLAPRDAGNAGGLAGPGRPGEGGVGVGLATGPDAVRIFVHELGHMHRRPHVPGCGASGAEFGYPHSDGRIDAVGFDARDNTLLNPQAPTYDMLSYCKPVWISAYTFRQLATAIHDIEAGPAVTRPGRRLNLLVGPDRAPRWLPPTRERSVPGPERVQATILDELERPVARLRLPFTELHDASQTIVSVPEARDGWAAISIEGHAPVRFDSP